MIRGLTHHPLDSSVRNLFARLETVGLIEESDEITLAHIAWLISQETVLANAIHPALVSGPAREQLGQAASGSLRAPRDQTSAFQELTLAQEIVEILERAANEAHRRGDERISLDQLIVALLEGDGFSERFLPLDERQWCEAVRSARHRLKSRHTTCFTHTPTLDLYSKDHTAAVREGRLAWPVCQRDREIREMLRILLRRTKRNPLLIGPAGCGKSALLTGLAQFLLTGPTFFVNHRVCELDIGNLVAGTVYRGELEARVMRILKELEANPSVLLCIDEIHLVQTGGSENSANVAEFFKAGMARDLSVIGATCPEQLDQLFRDTAMQRRFEPVFLQPLDAPSVRSILSGVRNRLVEDYRGQYAVEVIVPDDLLTELPSLAVKTLPGRAEPDASITLLQDAMTLALVTWERPSRDDQPCRVTVHCEHAHQVARDMRRTSQQIARARESVLHDPFGPRCDATRIRLREGAP